MHATNTRTRRQLLHELWCVLWQLKDDLASTGVVNGRCVNAAQEPGRTNNRQSLSRRRFFPRTRHDLQVPRNRGDGAPAATTPPLQQARTTLMVIWVDPIAASAAGTTQMQPPRDGVASVDARQISPPTKQPPACSPHLQAPHRRRRPDPARTCTCSLHESRTR